LHSQYAHSVATHLRGLGIRASVDDSEEKVGFRLRNSQVRKIPYTIVIGDNEMRDQTVTYRLYGQEKQVTVSQGDFAGLISEEIASKRHY